MATAAELEALVRKVVKEEVLGAKVQHKDDETGKVTDVSTETLLEYVDLRTQRLETAVKKLVAAVDALGKATSQPSA